jgi:isopenicillin N synthase-like dioxygenase
MEGLSKTFMHIFAIALNLPEMHFDQFYGSGHSSLNGIHYPEQLDEPLPGQLRSGAHTDWGDLTILKTDDAPGGLQVWLPEGDWADVPRVPGAFIVNLGDMMMRWTNDRWVSTLHRVVNPPRDSARGSRRLSLVFFHNLNDDAIVECIETCTGPGRPAKYPPIRASEFLRSKMQQAQVTLSIPPGTIADRT